MRAALSLPEVDYLAGTAELAREGRAVDGFSIGLGDIGCRVESLRAHVTFFWVV